MSRKQRPKTKDIENEDPLENEDLGKEDPLEDEDLENEDPIENEDMEKEDPLENENEFPRWRKHGQAFYSLHYKYRFSSPINEREINRNIIVHVICFHEKQHDNNKRKKQDILKIRARHARTIQQPEVFFFW